MILSYIIKDRLKEVIKKKLNKKILGQYFFDRKVEFFNPKTKRAVGHVRESFEYVDKRKLPPDVLNARYPLNSGKRFETIIRHSRVVTLFSKAFTSSTSNVINLTRLSINNFTSKMDDAETLMPCYADDVRARLITMSKVYHIHLILKLSSCCSKDQKHEVKHYRIVLNKTGIKRLEKLNEQSAIEATIYYPSPLPHDLLVEPEDISEELEVPLAHTKVNELADAVEPE